MKYLSVCSGIEAATVAWHPLGWSPVAFSEIDKFPRAVLQHRFPNVPLFGNFTEIQKHDLSETIDILVGGTPCQSFSIAGLRGGLGDDRGNLALQFCRLALRTLPRWIVWENVPGVLSSNEGRDFGSILGGLAECGYGFAYRVLDAQFVRVQSHEVAVPQRRRRVFVVGYLGDWRRAAAVLFERESVCGYPPPRREAGKVAARETTNCLAGGGCRNGSRVGDIRGQDVVGTLDACEGIKWGFNQWVDQNKAVVQPFDVANCMTHRMHKGINSTVDEGQTPVIAFSCKDYGADASSVSPAEAGMKQQNLGVTIHGTDKTAKVASYTDTSGALRTKPPGSQQNSSTTAIQAGMKVRRLTPLECERLQGFPDNWTQVPYRGKAACDGPRYKAIGNSMAVNVMSWIGQRIEQADGGAG